MACYLHYAQHFPTAQSAFLYFIERRCGKRIENLPWLGQWHKRYLQYFDEIMDLNGNCPNPHPLRLHSVIMNGVPNFDGRGRCQPLLEVFMARKVVYSSKFMQSHADILLLQDDFNVIFRTLSYIGDSIKPITSTIANINDWRPLDLEKDVEIRLSHRNDKEQRPQLVFSYCFNAGFVGSGLNRVERKDLDMQPRDLENFDRLALDFSFDLILSENRSRILSYDQFVERNFSKSLAKLTQFHIIKPDTSLLKSLESQGNLKLAAKYALQNSSNQIHEAHEYLATGMSLDLKNRLSQELADTGRSMYKARKDRLAAIDNESSVKIATQAEVSVLTPEPRTVSDSAQITHATAETLPTVIDAENCIRPSTDSTVTSPSPASRDNIAAKTDLILDLVATNSALSVTQQSEVILDPPDVQFSSIPPPPPPPPVKSLAKAADQKRVKHKLHWAEIKAHQLGSEQTIWTNADSAKLNSVSLDRLQFEELFCSIPGSQQTESLETTPSKQ